MDRISDLKHFIKRIHKDLLISGGIKQIVDLLDIGLILRQNLLNTCGIGNIIGSGQANECHHQENQQNFDYTQYNCSGLKDFKSCAASTSNHLGFLFRNRRRHLDVDRFGR